MIILNATLSIIIILIAHHIWEYCKQNYTTQKTKNLIEVHASKYKQIAEDIERNANTNAIAIVSMPVKLQPSDFLSRNEKEWVQTELSTFIDTL